ncbi:hypothetical protein [Mucilaginibacter pocheonensis]|uniref:T9SS C-terminal target domain-containing protein n=1 Tax=Mucilaginibacter pocheonensis TaxID=398050 RepID=A0ABU1TFQ7_9SPHI|nr:hypothetical protein [Mucilaginibacter pocheonensis]MDR6944242.1 hypothetical protein [Mucilaginibacter pocheonensis]
MKKISLVTLCLAAGILVTSCKKEANNDTAFDNRSTSAADYSASSLPVTTVSGDITANTTWDASHVWEISGVVTVRSGATLTINAGTFIKSTVNTAGVQNGVLVIAKGAKINAVGTATSPIVFTSRYLLDGNASTVGKPGDFGGVIILGNAKINVGDKLIEGLADDPKFHYGGTNDADNSGTLKYARIEYAGYVLAPNVEVNSLTLGGVGSGTVIDHIQASRGLDDGFEFFGGKVSPKYLISFANDDDQFDFDNGFTGSIQYAIAVADAYSTHSSSSGSSDSNGIESDNNAPAEDATFSLLPKTHPTLANFSVVGTSAATLSPAITAPGFKYGFRNRRGTEVAISNSLFTGYPSGIVFDADANATLSTLTNVSVHGFTAATAVLGTTGSFTSVGLLTSTAAAAPTWGMSQPFFNSGTLNFLASGTRGALTSGSGNWVASWTKFTF